MHSLCLPLFLVLIQSMLSGGMEVYTLVDQCLCEAVICLASVLLWAGRWDGYPYTTIWTAWHGRDAAVA